MKAAFVVALCLSAVACLVAADSAEDSPVTRVVELLEELKDRISQDGKEEQAAFDKFACWCEKTTSKKAQAIEASKAELKSLGSTILELRGQIASETAEIAKLLEDIKKTEEEMAKATAIREKEHAEYMAEKSELEQATAALEMAIRVLHDATKPALLEGAREGLHNVLHSRRAMVHSGLSPKQLALVGHFLKITGRSGYSPQSATILGILKEMYNSFTDTLESSEHAEATASRDFEDFMATDAKELATYKEVLEKTEKSKAEAETQLAEATVAFSDTEAQLKADIELFDATKASCASKGSEWGERKSAREEELKGIAKALEILTSDEAKETFKSSFLQTAAHSFVGELRAPAAKALAALKKSAEATGSLRLAALAAQLRSTKVGHFDAVIAAIDKLVQQLKEEGKQDEEELDECTKQLHDIDSSVADLDWKIKNNQAALDKLEELINAKEADKEKVIEAIADAKKGIADMEDQRKEENGQYLEEKTNNEKAIELLEKAKAALSEYFANNKIEVGPLQLLDETGIEPPPDARLSGKDSRKNESKGIISILTLIIDDIQGDIESNRKAEEGAQRGFEKAVKTSKKLIEELEAKNTNLDGAIAAKKQEEADENKAKEDNEQSKGDQESLEKDTKPNCEWLSSNIDERRKKRAMEIEGMAAAKEYLAGMEAPEAALTQISEDDVLPAIRFSTVSFLQRRA